MTPIHQVIKNQNTKINPIWIMRQAGRYLPEFREIRKLNSNFINLCLNHELSSEITLQPLKRFNLDAAIIFSDILMLPYGLNQKVKFKKDFGPILGELNINEISKINEKDFVEKIHHVYKAISKVSSNNLLKNKNTIGFGDAFEKEYEDTSLKKFFAPEFRNRLDGVITFAKLGKEVMMKIVGKFLVELKNMVVAKGITIKIDDREINLKLEECKKEISNVKAETIFKEYIHEFRNNSNITKYEQNL